MDKMRKRFRLLTRDDQADPATQVAAVIEAYHAALTENELPVPDDFSLYKMADSGDDGSTALYSVSDRYACWYVVVDGVTAALVAFYAYRYDDWCEDECFAYSEDLASMVKHAGDAPADNSERAEWLVKLLAGEFEQPAAIAKAYKPIAKDDAQRYTLGVAYPHSEVDSHGDFTDETELEQAAWGFMRDVVAKGEGGVGTDHAEGTDDSAQVVESYIYRGPDWTIGEGDDSFVVKSGDWMVAAVWTPEAWDRIEKGELTGWSIQGLAFIEDAELDEAA